MGLSAIKNSARLAIHGRMGEPCVYSNGFDPAVPSVAQVAAGLELTARFHTKAKIQTSEYDGLSIMEPIEKVVFNADQLEALGLVLEHAAEIYWPGYDVRVILDQPLDMDGPQNVYWTCTRA